MATTVPATENGTMHAPENEDTTASSNIQNDSANTTGTSTEQILAEHEPKAWPGPYLRLEPVPLSSFPSIETSSATNGTPENISISIHVLSILAEARYLAEHISQQDGWKQGSSKSYKSVAAPIENWSTKISAQAITSANSSSSKLRSWKDYNSNEYWFARKSVHQDAAQSGTASWAEFVAGLRDRHSENEGEYTPDIFDARLALDFDAALTQAGLHDKIQGLTMRIFEMCHKVPLRNRVFATLVVTGSITPDEFIVAQVPVQLQGSAAGYYSNEKHKQSGAKYSNPEMGSTVTIGQYVSIERCRRLPATGQVEWLMATASDAKGGIPMIIQRPAIPGTICKDVEFFVKWCADRRGKGDENAAKTV